MDYSPRLLESAVEFIDNPEPRCACVLLLDTSGSMEGDKIKALNQGLQIFKDELQRNRLASLRVEVAVVTFDSQVLVSRDFVTADQFDPPVLTTSGVTHMAAGIEKALDMVEARKVAYDANGILRYRPWIFMITDGEPQGEPDADVTRAAQKVQAAEKANKVTFYGVGVEGANMTKLARMVVRKPLSLKGLKFADLFVWLSRSMEGISNAKPGEMVVLPPADGWGTAG